GFHRRASWHLQARDRQAQWRARDRRQPQRARTEIDHALEQVRDVIGRVRLFGAILQGLRRQPAARTVPATVRRRRLLRSGPRSPCFVAVAAHRSSSRTARDACAAAALSAYGTGWGSESHTARRDYGQAGRPAVWLARRAVAW